MLVEVETLLVGIYKVTRILFLLIKLRAPEAADEPE